jgi:hypothetical protein
VALFIPILTRINFRNNPCLLLRRQNDISSDANAENENDMEADPMSMELLLSSASLQAHKRIDDEEVAAEDIDYEKRVEAAKATCRQRRYCTYGVIVLYLTLIYLYFRRRGTQGE